MPNNINYNDPHAAVIRINDFSPGIVNGTRTGQVYSTQAPLGSASDCFRCYSRPGIGLRPFPTYNNLATVVPSSAWHIGGALEYIGLNHVLVSTGQSPGSSAKTIVYGISGGASTVYTSATTNSRTDCITNIDTYWLNGVGPLLQAILNDIYTGANPSFVTINLFSAATTATTIAVRGGVTSATSRAVVMGDGGLFASDIFATTNFAFQQYSPERMGIAQIASWGSISTGEFFVINSSGGGVVITGDIANPTSAILLPAISAPGATQGPGVTSNIGYLYPTDADGVYVWNGGNTSEKISHQVEDGLLVRSTPTNGFTGILTQCNAMFASYAMFPNNYVYDTLGGSWWKCEDPNVHVFNVHAKSYTSMRFFYSVTPDFGTAGTPIRTFTWDLMLDASSYTWISNPLPFPGQLVSISGVEICASNPTNAPSTIIVTPTAPGGAAGNQTIFPNQNPQSVTFTIPPNTSSYRAFQRLGFTDYNVCVEVDTNNPSFAAPTLHELNITVDPRPSATP